MVYFKTLDIRWIWHYRIFYIAGITVMSLQIFLAVIFFTLYEETDRNSSDFHIKNYYSTQEHSNLDRENTLKSYRHFKDDQIEKENRATFMKFTEEENFGLSGVCNVSGREAISAINRATTSYCKQLILNTTCALKNNSLYPVRLPHSCPVNGLSPGKYLGCFRDSTISRLLNGAYYNCSKQNSQTYCINKCLQGGFPYAGVQFSDECFCGNEEPPNALRFSDSSCDMPCPSNASQFCGGYLTTNVFETGVAKFSPQIAKNASSYVNKPPNPAVRIVFLLTLNGRATRQVYRMIKMLFHRDHFFIHVDARQDYLFRELLSLELKLSNVRLSRHRYSTIWGGASLLTMLLQSMFELLQSSWDWDFIINLSESDYPIKTNEELVAFLSVNRNRNFVKSHGRDVHHFIHKQGLDKTFVECDEHMWRIGNKVLPAGIVIDGGSDWIALSRTFVNYIVTTRNDELLNGLKVVFKHTLLPAESYFHTVLRNSAFCDTYIDNNLHVTNWKRHLGCKCQYKHVVDWCGCSPNVFTIDDWSRIQATVNKSLFFARKFDPTVSQSMINMVEEWLYGRYTDEYDSQRRYWQNVYYYLDQNPPADDAVVTVCSSLSRESLKLFARNGRSCTRAIFSKLLQVTSFHEDDIQKGILVHFEASSNGNTLIEFEVWYKLKPLFTLYNTSLAASRFINLVVSTNFDAKEKMSRNYVGAIGPFSEPLLIYQLVAGIAVPNITVVWVNPVQVLVDVSDISLDEMMGVYHLKPNLKSPLLPGEWSVYLIQNGDVVAHVAFVVTPSQNITGGPVPRQHMQVGQYGLEKSKIPNDWAYLIPIIHKANTGINRSSRNEKLFYEGTQSVDLTGSLMMRSFKMEGFCVVSTNNIDDTPNCFHEKFQRCDITKWSSFSPDPKARITTIDTVTGRLH